MIEKIGFYGGVASIIALFLYVGGIFYSMNTKRLKKPDVQRQKLIDEISELVEITDAATTQGRRLDLYIYKESVLSHGRFNYMTNEIWVLCMHIISMIMITWVISVPKGFEGKFQLPIFTELKNNYNIDQSYHTVYLVVVVLFLVALNYWIRKDLKRYRRRLKLLSNVFIDSFEDKVSSRFDTKMSLRNKFD